MTSSSNQDKKQIGLSAQEVVKTISDSINTDWLYFEDTGNFIFKPDLLIKVTDNSILYGGTPCLEVKVSKKYHTNDIALIDFKITSSDLNIVFENVTITKSDNDDEDDFNLTLSRLARTSMRDCLRAKACANGRVASSPIR